MRKQQPDPRIVAILDNVEQPNLKSHKAYIRKQQVALARIANILSSLHDAKLLGYAEYSELMEFGCGYKPR